MVTGGQACEKKENQLMTVSLSPTELGHSVVLFAMQTLSCKLQDLLKQTNAALKQNRNAIKCLMQSFE
jgi:hypothetical protein